MLGVYAPGETIPDADAQQSLTRLNDMLDSWSNESLTCYAYSQQSGTLISGQQQYSIGTSGGANFAITRPLRINQGPGQAYCLDTNNNKYPIDVVSQEVWNTIPNSGSTVTSNYPSYLFYDPQIPLGFLNFYPYPNQGSTAYWISYLQFSDFSSLSASVSFPAGYNLALKTNLAVHLKPYFSGAQLDPDVRMQAMESKGNIKRTNMRPSIAVMEPELVSQSSGTYNIYTDRTGGATV